MDTTRIDTIIHAINALVAEHAIAHEILALNRFNQPIPQWMLKRFEQAHSEATGKLAVMQQTNKAKHHA